MFNRTQFRLIVFPLYGISFLLSFRENCGSLVINGLGDAFLNYDWVISANDLQTVKKNKKPLALHQVQYMSLTDFPKFVDNIEWFLPASRTAIYLATDNLTQLEKALSDIARIYDAYVNPSLYTFIHCRTALPDHLGISSGDQKIEIIRKIVNGMFRMNTNVYILLGQGHTQALSVFSVSAETIIQTVDNCDGIARSENNYERYCFLLQASRRSDLNYAVIRAASVDTIWDRLIARHAADENGIMQLSGGYIVRLFWDLRDSLNFTIRTVLADGYIGQHPNGTLKGLGAHLSSGAADISLDNSYITIYRARQLTPLFPVYLSKPMSYFRQPRSSKTKNLYSLPFNYWTWVLTIIPTVSVILITTLVFAWLGHPVHVNVKASSNLREPTVTNKGSEETLLWGISVFCVKSWYVNPPSVSTKLVALTAFFVSIVFLAAYSGAFVAGLINETIPVKTFNDLSFNGFNLLYNPTIYYRRFYIDQCPIYEKGFPKPSNHCTTDEIGVSKVFEGGFAYVSTYDVFGQVYRSANYTEQEVCGMVSQVGFGNLAVPTTMFVQKDSPLRGMFNLKLLHLTETGLNDRYMKLEFINELDLACPEKTTQYRGGLEFDDIRTAVRICLIGLFSALLLLGGEWLTNRVKANLYMP